MRVHLLVACALVGACGNQPAKKPVGEGSAASSDLFDWPAAKGAGAVTVKPGAAGKITGKVTYEGAVPESPISVPVDRGVCGRTLPDPELTVKDGALLDAVVWIEGASGPVQPGEARLTQKKCAYAPHVTVTTAGSKVVIGNDDPTLHNVHGYEAGEDWFNKATQGGGSLTESVATAGIRQLKCDVHPWMKGYVLAFDHPYYAKVDDEGAFALRAPPAGTYTLVVWHGKLGVKKQPIEVTADRGLEIAAAYP